MSASAKRIRTGLEKPSISDRSSVPAAARADEVLPASAA
jgi:hypothetical protein